MGSQGPEDQSVGMEGEMVNVTVTVACGYRVVTHMPWSGKMDYITPEGCPCA